MEMYSPPFDLEEIKIELTYKCPLACIHCSSDASPETQHSIKPELSLSLVKQAIDIGAKEISFSGGEPLVYANIGVLVELAASSGIKVIIYTSGNVSNFRKKIKTLKKNGLNKAIFSLYSPKEWFHENITRAKGSYNSTIAAIEQTISQNIECELHFVALSRNYKHLEELVDLSSKLAIKKVSVLRFVPQGRGSLLRSDILTNPQYMEIKKIIESLRACGHDIRIGSPFNFLLLSDQPACYSAKNRLIIAPDLRIYPCDAFKQIKAEEVVSTHKYSILNGSNLEECWIKSPYLSAVREYLSSPFTEPCNDCNHLDLCLSGCLAQKVLAHGNFDKRPDPACMRHFFKKGN